MNKILKILSILIIAFVMFSCSTPTNDPTPYVPEPSGPETPVETPSDDPVEETPEEPTYSITFIAERNDILDQETNDLLNSLSSELLNSLYAKKLKKDEKVELPKYIYTNTEEATLELTESSTHAIVIFYENKITSVVVGNEDIEIKYIVEVVALENM